jgi:hypothetical protein
MTCRGQVRAAPRPARRRASPPLSTTIEKSELRSAEDGVRISCFHRSCQAYVVIHTARRDSAHGSPPGFFIYPIDDRNEYTANSIKQCGSCNESLCWRIFRMDTPVSKIVQIMPNHPLALSFSIFLTNVHRLIQQLPVMLRKSVFFHGTDSLRLTFRLFSLPVSCIVMPDIIYYYNISSCISIYF